ncbi:hypothetical protein [Nocardia camponoti]|uniref:hypothetical protein n=1 Tax=Nocardia camponoti TaxID=1616106 RepID=UPI00166DA957|nr:hypothetical protein [Nocardia camponoti]
MSRTTAAIAASAAALSLLLAGCNDSSAAAPASTSAAPSVQVDPTKAGMFVVNFRGAFPKLAEGRDDKAIAGIFVSTCGDIKAGKSDADVTEAIIKNAKNGAAAPSKDEAATIHQLSKLMC